MWKEAFYVALVAGGWTLFLKTIPEIIVILTKKESKFAAWWITIMRGIADSATYAYIIPAAITGLVLGDLRTGLYVGGTIQLMFLGVFIVGASIPPSPFLASILTTALIILTKANIGEALALVVPLSIASQLLTLAFMSLNVFLVHWADRMAENGNTVGLDLLNTIDSTGWHLVNVIPAFLGVGLGVDAAAKLLSIIPDWLSNGLGATGGILPALGFGMLLLIIASNEVWPFFFIGFLLAAYMNVNALAGAILGICFAIIYVRLKSANAGKAAK
ncbi:MAG: mannose system component [Chloroflexota bacterium]|nr:mannose system component [Chloroflexota bacterium]